MYITQTFSCIVYFTCFMRLCIYLLTYLLKTRNDRRHINRRGKGRTFLFVLFIRSGVSVYAALFHAALWDTCKLLGSLSPLCILSIARCFFVVLSRYHWALTGARPIVGYKLRPAAPKVESSSVG